MQLLHKNNIGGVTRDGGFVWLDGSIYSLNTFKQQWIDCIFTDCWMGAQTSVPNLSWKLCNISRFNSFSAFHLVEMILSQNEYYGKWWQNERLWWLTLMELTNYFVRSSSRFSSYPGVRIWSRKKRNWKKPSIKLEVSTRGRWFWIAMRKIWIITDYW